MPDTQQHISNIYDFITDSIKDYERPEGVTLEEGWNWSMKNHISQTYLYINSQFTENNENRTLRPNKNIILPILNIQFRTEGFDVKDIELYADNKDEHYKSLLINKFHQNWALDNKIDTFIDKMVVSYCTYGGSLVKNEGDVRPTVIDLRNIAFADQTNILAYPFAIKHKFSPAQLRVANSKWGDAKYGATVDVETLIAMAKKEGKKEIEVFEVHGLMPADWLNDGGESSEYMDEKSKDVQQIQVVSFYKKDDDTKVGVTLFKHREPVLPFKFLSRDEIEGRALGRGGVEELFESQIWTNWDEIKITEMLASASKTLHWSTDPKFKTKNNLNDLENNEVLYLAENKTIQQLDTAPSNLSVFNDSVQRWQAHAQQLGSATDPLMGDTPSSGTPFKLYEAQQIEGKGLHKYRQGQLAVFMDEIYRDWILPHLAKEISKEQIFMQELSTDEMKSVVEAVMRNKANDFKKRSILAMQEVNDEIVDMYKQQVQQEVVKKGNKRFFNILAEEMKDIDVSVSTNIAGKQKSLALFTDKLVGVFRQYFEMRSKGLDTAALGLDGMMNDILESSGLSPLRYNPPMPQQQAQQANVSTQPIKEFSQEQNNQKQV